MARKTEVDPIAASLLDYEMREQAPTVVLETWGVRCTFRLDAQQDHVRAGTIREGIKRAVNEFEGYAVLELGAMRMGADFDRLAEADFLFRSLSWRLLEASKMGAVQIEKTQGC